MASLILASLWLPLLILSFFNHDLVCAREAVGPYLNEPAIAGLDSSKVDIYRQTFREAVSLAVFTAMYWPPCAAQDEVSLAFSDTR